MLTIQGRSLLRELAKVQVTEDGKIVIDTFAMVASRYKDHTKQASLEKYDGMLNSLIDYLRKQDQICLIDTDENNMPVYRVRHLGFHRTQKTMFRIFEFLTKSVLVPIIVSILTALAIAFLPA